MRIVRVAAVVALTLLLPGVVFAQATIRQEFTARLADGTTEIGEADGVRATHDGIRRGAIRAAREAVLCMRTNDEIGDDAFHRMEEELDWLEMAGGGREE